MGKVTFKRLHQHGSNTYTPGVEYDEKDIPEILKGVARAVAAPKKKSKGAETK